MCVCVCVRRVTVRQTAKSTEFAYAACSIYGDIYHFSIPRRNSINHFPFVSPKSFETNTRLISRVDKLPEWLYWSYSIKFLENIIVHRPVPF